jgi:hypothetical protein
MVRHSGFLRHYPQLFDGTQPAGNKLTGKFDGDKLEGTLTGNAIHFLAKDEQGGAEELTGTVQSGAISGTIIFTEADDKDHPTTHPFTACSYSAWLRRQRCLRLGIFGS